MFQLPTLVSLFVLAASKIVSASPCVTFDSNFNLLAFGLDGKDWNAGPQASWTNGEPLSRHESNSVLAGGVVQLVYREGSGRKRLGRRLPVHWLSAHNLRRVKHLAHWHYRLVYHDACPICVLGPAVARMTQPRHHFTDCYVLFYLLYQMLI